MKLIKVLLRDEAREIKVPRMNWPRAIFLVPGCVILLLKKIQFAHDDVRSVKADSPAMNAKEFKGPVIFPLPIQCFKFRMGYKI